MPYSNLETGPYRSCFYLDDESKRKIKVEIKPVRANGAATPSFDELSSVIGKLELAPPPIVVKYLKFVLDFVR
jgi:hypothetical protein